MIPLSLYRSARLELASHAARHGIKPPWLHFSAPDDTYAVRDFGIGLHRDWCAVWRAERPAAERALSWVLAHEFRHWLTIAGHIPIPVRGRSERCRRERKLWHEDAADSFAEGHTGLSRTAALAELRRLFDVPSHCPPCAERLPVGGDDCRCCKCFRRHSVDYRAWMEEFLHHPG